MLNSHTIERIVDSIHWFLSRLSVCAAAHFPKNTLILICRKINHFSIKRFSISCGSQSGIVQHTHTHTYFYRPPILDSHIKNTLGGQCFSYCVRAHIFHGALYSNVKLKWKQNNLIKSSDAFVLTPEQQLEMANLNQNDNGNAMK